MSDTFVYNLKKDKSSLTIWYFWCIAISECNVTNLAYLMQGFRFNVSKLTQGIHEKGQLTKKAMLPDLVGAVDVAGCVLCIFLVK